jgi:hypothetical protein
MVLIGGECEGIGLEITFETSAEGAVAIGKEILAAASAPALETVVGLKLELELELELVVIKAVVGMNWMELAVVLVVGYVVGNATAGVEGVAEIDVPTLKKQSGCGYSIRRRQTTNMKTSASQMFGSCESSTVIPKVCSCKGRPAVAHNWITDPIVTPAAYALTVVTCLPSRAI